MPLFVLLEGQTYVRPRGRGTTADLLEAGVFTAQEVATLTRGAGRSMTATLLTDLRDDFARRQADAANAYGRARVFLTAIDSERIHGLPTAAVQVLNDVADGRVS